MPRISFSNRAVPLLVAAIVLGLSSCGNSARPVADETAPLPSAAADVQPTPTPTPEVVRRTFTPEEFGVTLDDEGVPYELPLDDQSITSELIGAFHAPNGILRTMDGGAAQADPILFSADIAPNVDFGAAETFDLSIVWSDDVILGVRLDVPDSEVMWWTAFERAYETDGGVGAVMAESVLTELQENPLGENELLLEFEGSEQYILGDFDGVEGNDTIVFSNGWGDGAFPMTTAYDENDQLVSLFVFDNERHPWSLVIDEGTPPVDVTSRRTELQDCLAGRRDVIVHWNWTECPNDAPF